MPSVTQSSGEAATTLSERAAILIVTYNHAEVINDCLSSVLATDPGEVVVVDNGSTDGTAEVITEGFPEVRLVHPEDNLGFGSGNNLGVEKVDTEYLVFLNPDTVVKEGFPHDLLEPLARSERLITTPKILTCDGDRINTIGNVVHFSGLGFTQGYGESREAYAEPDQVTGISGACFATTTELFDELGGFEESIFLYMDDVELSWKANALGVNIRYVPTAVIRHDYEGTEVTAEKLFHLERGRYLILRKYLGVWGALLVFPSLVATELLAWGYAAALGPGGMRAKTGAVRDGFSTDVNGVDVDPRRILGDLDSRIPIEEFDTSPWVTRGLWALNALYRLNQSLVER